MQGIDQFPMSCLSDVACGIEKSAIRNPQSAIENAGETPALQSAIRNPQSAIPLAPVSDVACGIEKSAIRNPQSAIPLPLPWRRIERCEVLDSTQLEARRRAAAGEAMGGVAIWAERQSAGRGRLDHGWVSEGGGLYVTIGLPYDLPFLLPDTGWIALLAALAAVEALREHAGVEASIKWPNDLIAGGGKIGGLLGEMKSLKGPGPARLILIGLGLNWCNRVDAARMADPSAPPRALAELRPGLAPEGREAFLRGWLERLNDWHAGLERDYNTGVDLLRGRAEAVLWRKDEIICLKHTECGPLEGLLRGLGAGGSARLEVAPGQVREVHCGCQMEG